MEKLPEKPKNTNIAVKPGPGVKAIDLRRSMATMPEIAKSLNNIEKYIFVASTKKRISEIDDSVLVDKMGVTLTFISKDIGYKIPDDKSEWVYICTRLLDVTKKYYSGFSLSDIKLAFELLSTGELDSYLPKGSNGQPEKNHFQQFNIEYFCRVMNAYKEKQGQVINKAYKALPMPENTISQEQINKYHNETVDCCKNAFLNYKETKVLKLMGFEYMFVYEWLLKTGLAIEATPDKEDREKAFSLYMARAASGLVNEWDARKVRDDGVNSSKIDFGAFEVARERKIKSTFDEMILQDVNIDHYLNYK